MANPSMRAEQRDPLPAGEFEFNLVEPSTSQHATLRILGHTFGQSLAGGGIHETKHNVYDSAIAAVTVFEHHVTKLLASGFRHPLTPPSSYTDVESLIDDEPEEPTGYLLLAELLRASGDPRGELIEIEAARLRADTPDLRKREDELLRAHGGRLFGALEDVQHALPGTFSYEHFLGFVREATVADADAVALADGFESLLLRADPRDLGFDPRVEPPAPHTYAIHALRRLLHHPAGRFIRRLRIEVHAELDPFVSFLMEHGRIDRVSHLSVTSRAGGALGPSLPGLLALACYARALGGLTASPLPQLERVTVRWEAAGLSSVLAALSPDRLPALQHLALWDAPLDAKSTSALLDEPILAQIGSLDLWSQITPRRGMYEALLARRRDLAHLERLVLARHGAPADLVAQFADWPAVIWTDRTRAGLEEADREAIAGFPLGGVLF
ncbi:hypothetical protein [Sorangium sp. So ce426]|uniref:hypothetical protein n=1 Tax=Sorangium sp. So ce426 TaxID=3133312 RepID=UPI003F5C3E9C